MLVAPLANAAGVKVSAEHRKALEALFVAAMKARVTDDVVTIGDANARNRPRHVSHYGRQAKRMA